MAGSDVINAVLLHYPSQGIAVPGNVITRGSEVVFHFTLSLAGGLVVDTTYEDEPLTLTIGDGSIAEGLEKYLIGLTQGDRRQVEIPAGEVYSPLDPDAIQTIPRSEFPPEIALQPGQVMGFTTPSGEEVPATILVVSEDSVQVDFSHPLASHDLIFEVEILTVAPATDGSRA
jgi:FKBP-type peptidyl-prolyl cis-trans isomerase SlpA